MIQEQFLNVTYKIESTSDSFEAYLEKTGIPDNMRSIISSDDTATIKFTKEGNTYTSHSTSKLRNETVSFTPGEEFDYTAPHGKTYKSKVTMEDDKITYNSTDKPSASVTMQFQDDKLVVTFKDGDCTATRVFKQA